MVIVGFIISARFIRYIKNYFGVTSREYACKQSSFILLLFFFYITHIPSHSFIFLSFSHVWFHVRFVVSPKGLYVAYFCRTLWQFYRNSSQKTNSELIKSKQKKPSPPTVPTECSTIVSVNQHSVLNIFFLSAGGLYRN